MHLVKYKSLMFLLIAFPFLADAILGVFSYYSFVLPSPPVVLRTIIVFCSVIAFVGTAKYWLARLFVCIMSIFGLVAIILGSVNHSYSEFMYDFGLLIKVLYGPLLFFLLLRIVNKYNVCEQDFVQYILYGGLVLAGFVFIPAYFNIGVSNYEDVNGSGSRGLLFTANESGLELGMILGVALRQAFQVSHRKLGFVSALFISLALVCLQSRFSLLALLVSPILVLFLKSKYGNSSGKKSNLRRKLFVITLCVAMLGFFWQSYNVFMDNDFQRTRLEESSQGAFPRAIQIAMSINYIADRDISFNVFGEGASAWGKNIWNDLDSKASDGDVGQAELDWLDIFGTYGVVFSIAMYGFYIYILLLVWSFKEKNDPELFGIALLGMFFYFLHASVAGHAMSSAAPSGVFMYLVVWCLCLSRSTSNRIILEK